MSTTQKPRRPFSGKPRGNRGPHSQTRPRDAHDLRNVEAPREAPAPPREKTPVGGRADVFRVGPRDKGRTLSEPSRDGEEKKKKVPGTRRALTHVGGESKKHGDPDVAQILSEALDVLPSREGAQEEDLEIRPHVHGFHSYPARMHPVTASRLIASFSSPGDVVLDPFCGSGTVLVEAMLQGRYARGVDLNPIGVALTRAKVTPASPAFLEAVIEEAHRVAASADERRTQKAGPTRRYPQEDLESFDRHVLLELDGIRAGIEKSPKEIYRILSLILSAILTKLSKKSGDSGNTERPKRIAAGYPARLFIRKTEEWATRKRAFEQSLPEPRPRFDVHVGDAKKLSEVRTATVDLVVTSPPYVATYDYLSHHEHRLRWLGLPSHAVESDEIGARRTYRELGYEQAKLLWHDELVAFLSAIARTLKPGGRVILLLADSAVAGGALRADAAVSIASREVDLEPIARASQARPHFHWGTQHVFLKSPRHEHALLLIKPQSRI